MHKNGRPPVASSIVIKDTLLKCYKDGLSAYYTSQKTGYNIKTVCKYFNEWSDEIEESEISDFIERQKRDRVQVIISYDSQIDDVMKFSSQINSEIETCIKEKKSIPRHLLGFKLDAMRFRSSLLEKKAAFAMLQPTDDELIAKIQSMKK